MGDPAKVVEARDSESLEEVRERFKRWRETRGRGEHVPRELSAAAVEVAGAQGLHREIDAEGEIINGQPNFRFALAETLSRRAMSLRRHLQIHARATRGEARQVARLAVVPTGDDNPLIPRLPRQ